MNAKPPHTSALHLWRREPFRVFFPLGLAGTFVGVSHWLWYYTGLTTTYSCYYHGLVQVQGFHTAFAVGFLMTAVPVMLDARPSKRWELGLALALLVGCAAALFASRWALAQWVFLGLLVHLSLFGARRGVRRRSSPPPELVWLVFGVLHAAVGAVLILFPLPGFLRLGQRLVEQGMLLCFILGVSGFLGRILLGYGAVVVDASDTAREAKSGAGPRRSVATYLVFAAALFVSFWVEAGWSVRGGRLLRAVTLSVYLLAYVGIYRPPGFRLLHVHFLWLGLWCLLLSPWCSALFPDYETVAVHLMFVGGFGLMTLFVGMRVVCAHCGFEALWRRNTVAVSLVGLCILLALAFRISADFWLSYYFGALHLAAGFWDIGILLWAAVFLPKLRHCPGAR